MPLTARLDELFPLPSVSPPSRLSPARFPGASPESARALVKTLRDNHTTWHAYYNEMGFHK